jgi:hypothetical protein
VQEINPTSSNGPDQAIQLICPSLEPPPTGWLKLNVDAGIMQGNGTVWGLEVRNHLSEVIYVVTRKYDLDVKLSKVLFEMDAKMVFDCFHDKLLLAPIEPFILDCKSLFAQLWECSMNYSSHVCNSTTHYLAQATKHVGTHSWMRNATNFMDCPTFFSALCI